MKEKKEEKELSIIVDEVTERLYLARNDIK